MTKTMLIPAPYHDSLTKRILDLGISLLGLLVFSPLILVISILIKLTSNGSVFFVQKRTGKQGKTFDIVKFRTMRKAAVSQQWRFKRQNEADGPVFKIRNDPRYTKFGKVLSKTGLDELPQLINVLKGEMSLVGPRPLPISEAAKLTADQKKRHLIKPGLTSLWVVNGAHTLTFDAWMKLDQIYLKKASLNLDTAILLKTAFIIFKSVFRLAKSCTSS